MRFILILSLAAGTSGCLIYDNDGDGPRKGRAGIENPETETGEAAQLPAIVLGFAPSQAEQGETFIGSITVEDGDLDLGEVSGVEMYGDAEVTDILSRSREILVSVEILPDAQTGAVDMVVELQDGTAVWMETAFELFEAGSGNSADDWESPNPDSQDECP